MQPLLFDPNEENPQENLTEKEKLKAAKLQEEIQELLNNLSSATVNTLRDKVAWILNQYPDARDSDVALMLHFWETFEPNIYNGHSINPNDLYHLTRLTSIARERARVQNVYKLFQASSKVRQRRGTLSEEEKEKAVEDRPVGYPSLTVYMDESGKNADQLIVGSVWFLESGKPIYDIHKRITAFKEEVGFAKEFHFANMTRHELRIYQEMLQIFIREAPSYSFKIISVPARGIRNKQEALKQLFYHLLVKGIENENDTGRAALPRSIQIWKDAEEEGADRLLVADLDDKLKQASPTLFDNKLHVGLVRFTDSEHNLFLQIADLFSASANRILNESGVARNHKTEFAEFFLDAVGVDRNFSPNDKIGDTVAHISL
jgi:hypothetical protein